MKRIILFALFFLLIAYSVSGQVMSQDKVRQIQIEIAEREDEETRTTRVTKALNKNTALFFTAQIPITFGNFDYKDGEWSESLGISIGTSFVFMVANMTRTENEDFFVTPLFFIGPYISYGAKSDSDSDIGSICLGGVLGISYLAISFGYDLFNQCPTIGIGTKIESFMFSDSLSTSTLNKIYY